MKVKAKKHLGQHFLKDENICNKIVDSLIFHQGYKNLLEVGPGLGAITKFLVDIDTNFKVIEIDRESIAFLGKNYPQLEGNIIQDDFLKIDFTKHFDGPVGVIGNFPYNISTQILFKVLEHRDMVPEVVGMFQKEVAQRIAEKPGTKTYGIISVFLQAFYDIEYLFDVPPIVFRPPPKVMSGVIRLTRNNRESLDCDEKLFLQIVKGTFNVRRKTIRNGVKKLFPDLDTTDPIFDLRPEKLSVDEFVYLTNLCSK